MGIILGETAYTGKSVELAALLITVHGAELCETQRQVAVGTRRAAEYLAVMRAVHRLEHIFLTLLRGLDELEGILAVFCKVS